MANQLTKIANELINLIQSNYPRFKDTGRIELTNEIDITNLGYEDCIMLVPQPTETAANLTAGKIANYIISLVYFKKLYDKKISEWSDFAESLDSYLLGYIHHSGYWTHLEHVIGYDIGEYLPEDYGGELGGFVITLIFIKYKDS